MNIHRIPWLRRLVLALLRRFGDFDVRIRHHHTGDRFCLNAYRHKGFWYHGRKREGQALSRCRVLLKPTDTVIEVGGHIGYLTILFARCANRGRVYVFEPGQNNLPYLRRNTEGLSNVVVVPNAAADVNGPVRFSLDPLTGQNNSLLTDYYVFEENKSFAYRSDVTCDSDTVEAVRLDDFVNAHNLRPRFVKIDAEGAEWTVLRGMTRILRDHQPKLMIEVTLHHAEVERLLRDNAYTFSDEEGNPLKSLASYRGNFFAMAANAN